MEDNYKDLYGKFLRFDNNQHSYVGALDIVGDHPLDTSFFVGVDNGGRLKIINKSEFHRFTIQSISDDGFKLERNKTSRYDKEDNSLQ